MIKKRIEWLLLICVLIFVIGIFCLNKKEINTNTNSDNILADENFYVRYKNTSNVSLINKGNGYQLVKEFTVYNDSESDIYYDIELEDVINSEDSIYDLVYSLYSENGAVIDYNIVPSVDSNIAKNILLKSHKSESYKLVVVNNSSSESNTFSSNIKVVKSNENNYKINSLYYMIMNGNIGSETDDKYNYINGVYYTNSSIDGSSIYYYRGNVNTNNNVIFANMCFKILRTTESNGVKLVYNGIYSDNKCDSNIIGNVAFNNKSNKNAYIGYLYGNASSDNYYSEHNNLYSSNIKTRLEKWVNDKLISYNKYFDNESIYCNNKSTVDFTYKNVNYGMSGYGSNNSGYYDGKIYLTNSGKFSLNCVGDYSKLSVSNNYLKYSVGLLTLSELSYSGYLNYGKNSYLYSLNDYWTMSSAYYDGNKAYNFIVSKDIILPADVSLVKGVRPVITINGDIVVLYGDGSSDKPYILN